MDGGSRLDMKSFQTRLFAGITGIILATGVVGGVFAYNWAFNEAIEMQDSVLGQIGFFAQTGRFESGQPIRGVDADAEVTVVELHGSSCPVPDVCRLAGLSDGLRVTSLNGESVRALLKTRPDGSRFAVTQRTSFRNEIASGFALRALLSIVATIPCLMLITAFVIRRSLRPLVDLAKNLNARRADDLTALSLSRTLSELVPFIASINSLFDRITVMIERQKRFVSDAAHELRTPIAALVLQVDNLQSMALPPEASRRLATLQDGIRRTKHLLEQLLSLARVNTSLPDQGDVTSLDRIAKDVVADLLQIATHKTVDLGFARLEQASTKGEPLALATMIRNLVDNAVRFTPPGGRVDISLFREGDQAILTIEDTGPGVPSHDLDRIFEPFFRGNCQSEEGTGLGLAIVKRIVERLKGSIVPANISSSSRTGFRVTVRLAATEALSSDVADRRGYAAVEASR
jgi:two-component system OmpR family sensor kinase